MNGSERSTRLLLVEDNQGDAFLIKEMLRDTKIDLRITVAENGQKALDLLSRSIGSSENSFDFVILDLNLPKVHGFDVLSYMKSMHGLKNIPVVVMTGSLNEDDEVKARGMGAANFLIKPSCYGEFEAITAWMTGALSGIESDAPVKCPPQAPMGEGSGDDQHGMRYGPSMRLTKESDPFPSRLPDPHFIQSPDLNDRTM